MSSHPERDLLKEWNEENELRQTLKALGFNYFGMTSGRFQSQVPNLQTLPKDVAVDYGEMETRMIMAVYPGADGIGADVMDILRMEDVIYADAHRAKVLRFDANKDSAEIQFNDPALMPPTMWVPIRHLKYAYGGSVVNVQTHCPKCRVQWKETMLARFSVWDCPSCGAKKEDHAT